MGGQPSKMGGGGGMGPGGALGGALAGAALNAAMNAALREGTRRNMPEDEICPSPFMFMGGPQQMMAEMLMRHARQAANEKTADGSSSSRQRQPSSRPRASMLKNIEKSILEEFKQLLTEYVSYLEGTRQESVCLIINNMSSCIDAVMMEVLLILEEIKDSIQNYESTEEGSESDDEEENGKCPWEWFRSRFREIERLASVNQNVAYRVISLYFITVFKLFCSSFPTLSSTYTRDLNAVSFEADDYQCSESHHTYHRPINFDADFSQSFHFGHGMINDRDTVPFFRPYFKEMRTSEDEDERSWFRYVHDNNAIYIFQCKRCNPENHYKSFYVGYTGNLRTRLRNHRSLIKHSQNKTLPNHIFRDIHRVARETDRDVLQKYYKIFIPAIIGDLEQNIWRCQEVFYQWLFGPNYVMNQR